MSAPLFIVIIIVVVNSGIRLTSGYRDAVSIVTVAVFRVGTTRAPVAVSIAVVGACRRSLTAGFFTERVSIATSKLIVVIVAVESQQNGTAVVLTLKLTKAEIRDQTRPYYAGLRSQ